MISHLATQDVAPRRYPTEFRRKVLALVAAGRPVAQITHGLQISAQAIYTWRRQHLTASGQMAGVTSSDHAELQAWSYIPITGAIHLLGLHGPDPCQRFTAVDGFDRGLLRQCDDRVLLGAGPDGAAEPAALAHPPRTGQCPV